MCGGGMGSILLLPLGARSIVRIWHMLLLFVV